MAVEEKTAGPGTIATVVATAAVTLAIGVTAAALGGYLAPAHDRDKAAAGPTSEPMLIESPAAARTDAPNVVLVPVAPDGQGQPSTTVTAPQEPDVLLAAYDEAAQDHAYEHEYEHDDEGDHHRGREHHEHKDEDDHDDED